MFSQDRFDLLRWSNRCRGNVQQESARTARRIALSFQQFTFPKVLQDLGLTLRDGDLFSTATPFAVREEFASILRDGVELALANSTEKGHGSKLGDSSVGRTVLSAAGHWADRNVRPTAGCYSFRPKFEPCPKRPSPSLSSLQSSWSYGESSAIDFNSFGSGMGG